MLLAEAVRPGVFRLWVPGLRLVLPAMALLAVSLLLAGVSALLVDETVKLPRSFTSCCASSRNCRQGRVHRSKPSRFRRTRPIARRPVEYVLTGLNPSRA